MKLLQTLLRTDSSPGLLVARLSLGLVILPHGLQKTVGWFGGYGFTGTMQFFTETMGIPWPLALAAVLAESIGALLLILGALTRVSALTIGVVMAVAMTTSHLQHGFFMNWFGNQAGEGFEYFLLAIGLAAALVLAGGGALSLDGLLRRRVEARRA